MPAGIISYKLLEGAQMARLTESQIDEAARLLARAFQNDPLWTYALPDAGERARLLPAYFGRIVRYGNLFGEVETTSGVIEGVAVWVAPEGGSFLTEQRRQAGLDEVPSIIGAEAVRRLYTVVGYEQQFRRRDASGPHWYLVQLGVDPPRQGRGIGGSLLEPVIARADREGLVCYLETENEKNVTFYRRRGFELMADDVEPVSGLKFWTFRRNPARRGPSPVRKADGQS